MLSSSVAAGLKCFPAGRTKTTSYGGGSVVAGAVKHLLRDLSSYMIFISLTGILQLTGLCAGTRG